jgi:hypothetical protein
MHKKMSVLLVLVAMFCASAQPPPTQTEVYKGYVATQIPLPTESCVPIQSRVSPNGQILAVECQSLNGPALFLLRQGDSAWQFVGRPNDFSANKTMQGVQFQSYRSDGNPRLDILQVGGMEVTNQHVLVTVIKPFPGIPDSNWLFDTASALNLQTLQIKHLLSIPPNAPAYSQFGDLHAYATGTYAVFRNGFGVGKIPLEGGEITTLPTSEIQTQGYILDAWPRADGSLIILTADNSLWINRQGKNKLLVDGRKGVPVGQYFDRILVCCDVVTSGETYIGYKDVTGAGTKVWKIGEDDSLQFVTSTARKAGGSLVNYGIRLRASSLSGLAMTSQDNINFQDSSYPKYPDTLWVLDSGNISKLTGYNEMLLGSPLYGLRETSSIQFGHTNVGLDNFGNLHFVAVFKASNGSEVYKLIRLARPRPITITPSTVAQGQKFTITGAFLSFAGLQTDIILGAGTPADACRPESETKLVCSSANFPVGDTTVRVRVSGSGSTVISSSALKLTVTAPLLPIGITRFVAEQAAIAPGQMARVCFYTTEAPDGWKVSWTGLSGATQEFGVGEQLSLKTAAGNFVCLGWLPPETGDFVVRVSARGNVATAGPIRVEVNPPLPQITSVANAEDEFAPLLPGSRANISGQFLASQACEANPGVATLCGVTIETPGGEAIPILATSQTKLVIQLPNLTGEFWIRVVNNDRASDWIMVSTAALPDAPPENKEAL